MSTRSNVIQGRKAHGRNAARKGHDHDHDRRCRDFRLSALRRDDRRIGLDLTVIGGVVTPHSTPTSDRPCAAAPTLFATSGEPISRPKPAEKKTRKPRRTRAVEADRHRSFAALMTAPYGVLI